MAPQGILQALTLRLLLPLPALMGIPDVVCSLRCHIYSLHVSHTDAPKLYVSLLIHQLARLQAAAEGWGYPPCRSSDVAKS